MEANVALCKEPARSANAVTDGSEAEASAEDMAITSVRIVDLIDPEEPDKVYGCVSVLAPDRPGIVLGLTKRFSQHNANIDMSYGTRLENIHNSVFRISGARQEMDQLFQEIRRPRCEQLSPGGNDSGRAFVYTLRIKAPDRIGILRDVCEILFGHDINIKTLANKKFKKQGKRTTRILMELEIPQETIPELATVMDQICSWEEKEGWEVDFQEQTEDDNSAQFLVPSNN